MFGVESKYLSLSHLFRKKTKFLIVTFSKKILIKVRAYL